MKWSVSHFVFKGNKKYALGSVEAEGWDHELSTVYFPKLQVNCRTLQKGGNNGLHYSSFELLKMKYFFTSSDFISCLPTKIQDF